MMPPPRYGRLPSILLLLCLTCGCQIGVFGFDTQKHLRRAEEYLRQKKYDQAVGAYRKHMEYRLSLEDRPEWENPNFYLLMIGDIQLGADRPGEALKSYEEADKKGVEQALVLDRYRYMASWYEKHSRLSEALELLGKYRERDPLLFDIMLDRIARSAVRQEDSPPQEPVRAGGR